jgi:hypothetical protein
MFASQTLPLCRVVHLQQKLCNRLACEPGFDENVVEVLEVAHAPSRLGKPHECHGDVEVGVKEVDSLRGGLPAEASCAVQPLRFRTGAFAWRLR